jgi:hypothetical protein
MKPFDCLAQFKRKMRGENFFGQALARGILRAILCALYVRLYAF